MLVTVIAPPGEQWPLPWYVRTMTRVGYWTDAKGAPDLTAPVIVSSIDHEDMLDAALGDRYVSEFYGLRPDVLLTLYVERGLWDQFLSRAATGGRGVGIEERRGDAVLQSRTIFASAAGHARIHLSETPRTGLM